MMQAVEENRRLSVFQRSSVFRRFRQAACLSRFSTCDSRPSVSDASGRWGLCLYRFGCTPSKLAWFFPPGTRVLLPPYQYRLRPLHWYDIYRDRKPTLNPCFWGFFFFAICRFRGVSCPDMVKLSLLPCGV